MSITSDTDKTSIMKKNKCSLAAVFLLSSVPIISAETIEQKTSQDAKKQRPNILWLTFEDTSWYEFGCYGNRNVNTPVIDSLASEGILFTSAWATAPQSSPARSSLITGCYATSYGMDLHPYPFDTPYGIFFTQYLRDAGYYCTNNSKTHYNTTIDNKKCWDECSAKASYNSPSRKEGQPFFAVFNSVRSHMGIVRTFHTEGRRDYTLEGINPDSLILPSHIPDMPEIRSDYAAHLEGVQDIDKWVEIFLKDLKLKGLDKNTIIFFFSDHGGCLPRGKGLPFETGLHVPMIVYIPPAYTGLFKSKPGSKDNSLINFIDLAPTMLSIARVKPPEQMQGRPFMGMYASKHEKEIDFAFCSNQLHHFMPMRVARDKRFKYFRSYIPYRQFALRNYYQWGMPANQAWDRLIIEGGDSSVLYNYPYNYHPAEMLFDLEKDPFETLNLADKKAYGKILKKFRKANADNIRKSKDIGFFLPSSREKVNLYKKVRKEKYPLELLYKATELAGVAEPQDYKELISYIGSKYDDIRFWGVCGFANLIVSGKIKSCPDELKSLMEDSNPYISAEASLACAYLGDQNAVHKMAVAGCGKNGKVWLSALECLSKDKSKREMILKEADFFASKLENLPFKENEDAGFMIRGILADIGYIAIDDIYKDFYKKGLELNNGRRPIVPKPI